MIRDNPFNWDHLIRLCALAYNNTPHESTKIAPAKLVYGRYLSLAIDLVAPIPTKEFWAQEATNREEYVVKLQSILHEINEKARHNLKHAALKQRKYYNVHLTYYQYKKGDIVYYHYPIKDKKSSKDNYYPWKGPYFIVQVLSDCLYRIQAGPNKPSQVIHHNKLKKGRCRETPDTSWIDNVTFHNVPKPQTSETTDVTSNVDRPRRFVKSPNRYGDWLY